MEHSEAPACAGTAKSVKSVQMLTCESACMPWRPRSANCVKFAISTATVPVAQGTNATRFRPSTRSTEKRSTC